MDEWLCIVALTLGAGIAMPIGAVIASVERIRPAWLEREFRHSVVAFGGGALLSAVALVLVPEGSKGQSTVLVVTCFAAGGVAFMALDVWLESVKSPAGQLAAMLSDFLPEALALGAACAHESAVGPLLAGLMALQNLPEGFNAYRELISTGKFKSGQVIVSFSAMALLGPTAGLVGYFWVSDYPAVVSAIMLFAAGGILYLVFQDIAPQAKLKRHWAPPLGAVAGFLLGLIGQILVGG
jgi:ZIP family zinc transporter